MYLCFSGGYTGEKWSILLDMVMCQSCALYPAAYGLALAILTTWFRNYLTHQANALMAETRLPQ